MASPSDGHIPRSTWPIRATSEVRLGSSNACWAPFPKPKELGYGGRRALRTQRDFCLSYSPSGRIMSNIVNSTLSVGILREVPYGSEYLQTDRFRHQNEQGNIHRSHGQGV